MALKSDYSGCEDLLDLEVADLVGLEPDTDHPSAEQVSTSDAHTGDRRCPDEPDGSVTIGQFRTLVSGAQGRGVALTVDVCDESGRLLLPAGSRVTLEFVSRLRDRGITRIRLRSPQMSLATPPSGVQEHAPGGDDLHTPLSRELDERSAGELAQPIVYRAIKGWRRPRMPIDNLKHEAASGVDSHEATSVAVAQLCAQVQPGLRISAPEVRRSVAHFVEMATIDFDLLPMIVAMQRSKDEYLYDHGINVALLSMAIASQLGLTREQIMHIGLGGMLHDIGMLRVPSSIRCAQRALTDSERHEIRRHPLHTLDMLSGLREIPLSVKFIAYQVHERADGSGYPRGRSGNQIHEYAKIVSLADTYAAMTRARPHRGPVSPYVAMRTILLEGSLNKFDRGIVRAFLDAISLFPIGSRVGLSDGTSARVLRANPDLHTRPVVEQLSRDGSPTGQIIDLADDDTPRIISTA